MYLDITDELEREEHWESKIINQDTIEGLLSLRKEIHGAKGIPPLEKVYYYEVIRENINYVARSSPEEWWKSVIFQERRPHVLRGLEKGIKQNIKMPPGLKKKCFQFIHRRICNNLNVCYPI